MMQTQVLQMKLQMEENSTWEDFSLKFGIT